MCAQQHWRYGSFCLPVYGFGYVLVNLGLGINNTLATFRCPCVPRGLLLSTVKSLGADSIVQDAFCGSSRRANLNNSLGLR